LDVCCLKRPFDDQKELRIRLESEAILAILEAPADRVELVRGPAHDLENDRNPVPWRAARVREWLEAQRLMTLEEAALTIRTGELMRLGFRGIDALHLASAESARVDVFCTCDDRLLAAAQKNASSLRVRVQEPLTAAREILT
jgi:hypothetical protein